ncbi:MAG: helix-turn-helix domain-containing protein [Lachnospiraceae bacterium]|nr:helix-turn-helix domain-containing protein [Lachnospiraceae bacterium]
MIRAYSELYLTDARRCLANCLDYAVYSLGYSLTDFYNLFAKSDLATRFEKGDPFIISGHSGVELALLIMERDKGESEYKERLLHFGKSPEYWAGWALAFYQWFSACSFRMLDQEIPITVVLDMYTKYHEMDIMQFVDRINEIRQKDRLTTYLKMYRELRGYSQKELASLTGIPLKTLQHYEQGDKPLSKANATYLISLSHALDIRPEMLIET